MDMQDIQRKLQEIRRQRLAKLIEEQFGGSQAKFVEETNENQGEVSALLRSKSFGEKKARKIEEKCGLPKYWLDGDMAPFTASAQAKEIAKAFDSLSPTLQESLINIIEGFGVKVQRFAPEPALTLNAPLAQPLGRAARTERSAEQSSGSS